LTLQTVDSGVNIGTPDYQRLSVLPVDSNSSGVPDMSIMSKIMNPNVVVTGTTYSKTIAYLASNVNVPVLSGFPAIDGTIAPVPNSYVILQQQASNNDGLYYIDSLGNWTLQSTILGDSVLVVSGSSAMKQFTYDPSLPHKWFAGLYALLPEYGIVTSNSISDISGNVSSGWWPGATSTAPTTYPFITNYVAIPQAFWTTNTSLTITVLDYVYFSRLSVQDPWVIISSDYQSMSAYLQDQTQGSNLYTRNLGRSGLNFEWQHYTTNYYLVDPASTNIIDMLIITKGYYLAVQQWLTQGAPQPALPTPLELRTSYNYLLQNAMLSDTVVLQPGSLKLLFGPNADPSVQANFYVIQTPTSILTANQIKTQIVTIIENFFDITQWEFGETFYFSELAAAIHQQMPVDISSVVLVPLSSTSAFGTLYQVLVNQNEIVYPDITVDQITLVTSYTPTTLQIGV